MFRKPEELLVKTTLKNVKKVGSLEAKYKEIRGDSVLQFMFIMSVGEI